MGPEPTPPVPQPPDGGGGIARQAGVGAVIFAATLILLLGASSLLSTAPQPSGSAVASRSPAASAASPGASGAASASAGASAPGSASASGTPGPSGTAGASGSAGASGPPPSPTPAPSGNQILLGAGDIADCSTDDDAATARLLDQLPGTVFTAGDNALPDGSASQFTDCYAPTWGRQLARTRPAPGERDWATKDLAGYLGYFGAAAAPDGVTWYSYDLGWWHIVVLDSACEKVGGCTADSDQGRWLAKDLAASKATCTLAIWHRPLASSGVEGGDSEVASFWQALCSPRMPRSSSMPTTATTSASRRRTRLAARTAPRGPPVRRGDRWRAARRFGPPAANSEFRLAGEHGVLRLSFARRTTPGPSCRATGPSPTAGRPPAPDAA